MAKRLSSDEFLSRLQPKEQPVPQLREVGFSDVGEFLGDRASDVVSGVTKGAFNFVDSAAGFFTDGGQEALRGGASLDQINNAISDRVEEVTGNRPGEGTAGEITEGISREVIEALPAFKALRLGKAAAGIGKGVKSATGGGRLSRFVGGVAEDVAQGAAFVAASEVPEALRDRDATAPLRAGASVPVNVFNAAKKIATGKASEISIDEAIDAGTAVLAGGISTLSRKARGKLADGVDESKANAQTTEQIEVADELASAVRGENIPDVNVGDRVQSTVDDFGIREVAQVTDDSVVVRGVDEAGNTTSRQVPRSTVEVVDPAVERIKRIEAEQAQALDTAQQGDQAATARYNDLEAEKQALQQDPAAESVRLASEKVDVDLGLNQGAQNAFRENLGAEPLRKEHIISNPQMMNQAVDNGLHQAETALDNARKFNSGEKKSLTSQEVSGVYLYQLKVAQSLEDMRSKLRAEPNNEQLHSTVERLTQEAVELSQTLINNASDAGRRLQLQKVIARINQAAERIEVVVARAQVKKGSNLTAKERADFERITKELERAVKENEELVKQLNSVEAGKALKAGRKVTESKESLIEQLRSIKDCII